MTLIRNEYKQGISICLQRPVELIAAIWLLLIFCVLVRKIVVDDIANAQTATTEIPKSRVSFPFSFNLGSLKLVCKNIFVAV